MKARRSKTTRRRDAFWRRNLLNEALIHIIRREPGAGELADLLDVSISSVSRLIAALREERHEVVSVRTREGWRYQLRLEDPELVLSHPSSTLVVERSQCHAPKGKAEDVIYDDR